MGSNLSQHRERNNSSYCFEVMELKKNEKEKCLDAFSMQNKIVVWIQNVFFFYLHRHKKREIGLTVFRILQTFRHKWVSTLNCDWRKVWSRHRRRQGLVQLFFCKLPNYSFFLLPCKWQHVDGKNAKKGRTQNWEVHTYYISPRESDDKHNWTFHFSSSIIKTTINQH